MMTRHRAFVAFTAAALLAGCAGAPPPAACAATALRLLEPAPVFTGPEAAAALEGRLEAGRLVHTCEVQGVRQRVLVPRAGEAADCPRRGPGRACTTAWIPRGARLGR